MSSLQDQPWYVALVREPIRNKPAGRGSDHVGTLKKGDLFVVVDQIVVRLSTMAFMCVHLHIIACLTRWLGVPFAALDRMKGGCGGWKLNCQKARRVGYVRRTSMGETCRSCTLRVSDGAPHTNRATSIHCSESHCMLQGGSHSGRAIAQSS
jgi:hypothetical protein